MILRRLPKAADTGGAGAPTVPAGAAQPGAAPALPSRSDGARRRGPRPGHCTICRDTNRASAELLLAGGASLQSVSRKFDISYHALRRHWLGHVSPETKRMLTIGPCRAAELAAKLSDENVSVLDHFRIARAAIYNALDAATAAGDRTSVALLSGRLHENLNSVARLTGELSNSPLVVNQTNIAVSPAFIQMQAAIIKILAQHPQARADVIRAFREMERATPAPLLEATREGHQSAA